MSDWTAGYLTEIGYTYGYYAELNPLRIRLAFLNAGLVPPEFGAACELGFGQGMSVNLHAAASVVEWSGTDFNPAQAGFARELARISESGARLFDQAFDEFCNRADLPEFDYIGLHGIWSWISDDNRHVIVDFLRRKLKVGGVLYVSYNTQPGWAAMVPVRDLLAEHVDIFGADGAGIVNRADAAFAFVDRLLAANPAYARANPQVAPRIKKIREQNRNYVVHEYFNSHWQPMSFSQMARWLQGAKLDWACSANPLDAVDAVNLTPEQQELLKGIPDPLFRQTTRDFCVNQQFRKDYWVRGARNLTGLERAEALRAQRILLAQPRGEVSLKVTGSQGEVSLQEAVYGPILDQLADHQPRTLGQLEQAVGQTEAGRAITFSQILQAAMVLSATGALFPAQDDPAIQKARKHTDKLNAYLMTRARGSNELTYLASPVTGGGIAVPPFHQLFLLARQHGQKNPRDWAQFVWNLLEGQGRRLLREGKTIETAEGNVAELTAQAEAFADRQLPVLKALQVA
jgi:SAM-dependent methyltransferase